MIKANGLFPCLYDGETVYEYVYEWVDEYSQYSPLLHTTKAPMDVVIKRRTAYILLNEEATYEVAEGAALVEVIQGPQGSNIFVSGTTLYGIDNNGSIFYKKAI